MFMDWKSSYNKDISSPQNKEKVQFPSESQVEEQKSYNYQHAAKEKQLNMRICLFSY